MGKIMYKGQEFQGRIERPSEAKPKKDDYLLYKWDFTKSLVDEIQSLALYDNPFNLQPSEDGLQFTEGNHNVKIYLGDDENFIDKTIEVDFGDMAHSIGNRECIDFMPKGTIAVNHTAMYYSSGISANIVAYGDNGRGSTGPYAYGIHADQFYYENKTYQFYYNNGYFIATDLENLETIANKVASGKQIIYGNSSNSDFYKYIIHDGDVMVLGDARTSGYKRGLQGWNVKGVRIYDGMFIPDGILDALIKPTPVE